MTKDIQKWADDAMFQAHPIERAEGEEFIEPHVTILWMTPDPLGAIAAACRMYDGIPTYSLDQITDDERKHYFAQVQKTHLTAPLEFVKIHFFMEGVSRSFTHQHVRQRTAVFAQESLRFAVKDDGAEVVVPMSVRENPEALVEFFVACENMHKSYMKLINNYGIPAEDARELLPHATATRLNYATDLRNLVDHAGNRLCTQAQYHWRKVFNGIVNGVRTYYSRDCMGEGDHCYTHDQVGPHGPDWQFKMLADSALFRPVCYQRGHCPFQASFDRGCTIRERVELNHHHGRESRYWHTDACENDGETVAIPAINPAEWMLDPTAGITKGNRPT